MKRRDLLSTTAVGLTTPLVGCSGTNTNRNGEVSMASSASTAPQSPAGCGPAAIPLSELLTDETGDDSVCPSDGSPSFAIENERDATVSVTVDINQDGALTETYTLAPGERAIESRAFQIDDGLFQRGGIRTTVRIQDESEHEINWPAWSCYRHGVAITPDGLRAGWIEPLDGVGDIQHDCYAGDETVIQVYSLERPHTLTITVRDLCAGTETTETYDFDADVTELLSGFLLSGGRYEILVDVEDGPSDTYEYDGECRDVIVEVRDHDNLVISEAIID